MRLALGALALFVLGPALAQEVPTGTFTVQRFIVEGENPLTEAETNAVLAPFTGEQEGLGALQEAAQALETMMRERGYTFHRVTIPPQTSATGEFLLDVASFKLNEIEFQGNVHFSDENLRRSLPVLVPGATPNARLLSRYVQAANEHPSKRLNVTVRQSKKPDHVDAVVEVRDIKPQQIFSSINNRGSSQTGNTRISLGYQHSNLWDRDHVITASYTTSPENWRNVTQLGLFYQIPFYKYAGSLSLFTAFSDVDSGEVNDLSIAGSGRFFGARYTHALQKIDRYTHKAVIALEDKLFINTVLDAQGQELVQDFPDVRSRPLSFSYLGSLRQDWGDLNFHVDFVRNITNGKHNTTARYQGTRFGASKKWYLFRYGADLNYGLGDGWEFRSALNGQITKEPLISGEQFGTGGASSVRGFNEREISGDDGEEVLFEIWTPRLENDLRFLGFLGWGQIRRRDALPGEVTAEAIASVGVGARWHWKTSLSVSADLGLAVDGAQDTQPGDVKIHFNAFYRY